MCAAVAKAEEKANGKPLTAEEKGIIEAGAKAGFDASIAAFNSKQAEEVTLRMGGRDIKVPTTRLEGIVPPGTVISNKFHNPISKAAGNNGLDGHLVTVHDVWDVDNLCELVKAVEDAIPLEELPESYTKEREYAHYSDAGMKLAQASSDLNVKYYLLVKFVLVGEEKQGMNAKMKELDDLFGDDAFNVGKTPPRA